MAFGKILIMLLGYIGGGENFLIPAVYMSITGFFDIEWFVPLSIIFLAVISSFWYFVGVYIPYEKIKKIKVLKNVQWEKTERLYMKYRIGILIIVKFIYGLRIPAYVLAGLYGVPYWQFLLIEMTGTSLLIAAVYILSYSLRGAFAEAGVSLIWINVIFFSAFALAIAGFWGYQWLKHKKKRKEDKDNHKA